MAHNLDLSSGGAAMAYVGKEPWHGLGQLLAEGASIDSWIDAAKLGWTLDRVPVQYLVNGALRTVGDRFVLVRSDTGEGLSVVSDSYNPVQPREVLEFYRRLVDQYSYTLETAGALDGGRKVWALARTGVTSSVGTGDDLAAYLLLATSCDKTLATTATFTSIRVVCQNTLAFAFTDAHQHRRRHLKVPHNHRFVAGNVHRDLGLLDQAWEQFIARVRLMAMQPMKAEDVGAFYEELLKPAPDKPLSQTAQREHLTLRGLFKSAPGQGLTTARDTLWGAVNAVTYYVDHQRKARPDERLDSAWFGNGDALKERAWLLADQWLSDVANGTSSRP